jgi:microcystin degradation protein MlrC
VRVLVGAIGHESNTFTPFLTTMDDFYVRQGAEILEGSLRRSALAGIVDTLRAHDVELVPTIAAGAMPGGVVERSVYEAFKRAVLEQTYDVDGVCLYLHGAMRAEGLDYCENDLLRDLRAQLGPRVPVSIALDMHANIVREMAENVDAMVAYHTAPHTDAYETGGKAAWMLLQILEQGVRTRIGFAKVPFLLPGEMAQTALDPMASMMRLAAEIEAQPGVLSTSLANGHCWADVPDIGVAAVVVTDGDSALAQREANRLASAFWAQRAEFGFSAEAYSVAEAVRVAMAVEQQPVYLSDSGDNPGAGGTTDVPVLLAELIAQGAWNVVVASIWDLAAAEACMAAGVGRELTFPVGGKLDTQHGSPLEVTGTVRLLTDGHRYQGGVRAPWEGGGPVAVLNVHGIDVILSSTRLSFVDPAQLRALGLEPFDYRIVVLKRGYLTAPFQAISERSILALTPGATNCDLRQMTFHRVQRPMYPLDLDATWSPERADGGI